MSRQETVLLEKWFRLLTLLFTCHWQNGSWKSIYLFQVLQERQSSWNPLLYGVLKFMQKEERLVKWGVVFKKGGCHFFLYYTGLSNVIFLWVCMFCLFTPFLLTFFVFHGKNLILLNLGNRYVTSTGEKFLKSKNIVEHC